MWRLTFLHVIWRFVCRRWVPCLLVLSTLMAVGGFWAWMRPLWPRATWKVRDAAPHQWKFTPDGRMLVGLSERSIAYRGGSRLFTGGPVRFWDAATGAERLRILHEWDELAEARLSHDGRWLAVADPHGGLSVWDASTGQFHRAMRFPPDANQPKRTSCDFRFSPDSRLLAQERVDGKGIVLWDIATGELRAHLADARRPFEFSPDGQTLATATEGSEGRLWDVASGQERARLQGADLPIQYLTFSPDGTRLATTHYDKSRDNTTFAMEVYVWQVASGRVWAKLPFTPGTPVRPVYYRALKFSPDSRLLIVPSVPGESPLWDVSASPPASLGHLCPCYPQPGGKLQPGPDPVFSPDGRWVAVAGQEPGTLTVLEATTLTSQSVLQVYADGTPAGGLHFSPDDRIAAVQATYLQPRYIVRSGWRGWLDRLYQRLFLRRTRHAVKLFEVATGRELREIPGYSWSGFTPDGQALITVVQAEADDALQVVVHRWDVPSDRPLGLGIGVAGLVLILAVAFYGVWSRQVHRDQVTFLPAER